MPVPDSDVRLMPLGVFPLRKQAVGGALESSEFTGLPRTLSVGTGSCLAVFSTDSSPVFSARVVWVPPRLADRARDPSRWLGRGACTLAIPFHVKHCSSGADPSDRPTRHRKGRGDLTRETRPGRRSRGCGPSIKDTMA